MDDNKASDPASTGQGGTSTPGAARTPNTPAPPVVRDPAIGAATSPLSDGGGDDGDVETLDTTKAAEKVPKAVTEPTQDVVLTHEQQKRTDFVRTWVTFSLVAIFAGVLVFGGYLAAIPQTKVADAFWQNGKEFMSTALPAVTGLLGSAIGFYFGSRPDTAGAPKGAGR